MSKKYTGVIFQRADGQWGFRIVAKNGEILTSSEGYTRKWSAKRAVRALTKTPITVE